MFKNYLNKWKKKSVFSKFTDILFIGLIVALLFPGGRMAIGGFVNGLKARISQPALMAHGISLSDQSWQWRMEDMEGQTHNLEITKGKVVFLNLWATWCPPCVGEMPGIQKLYDKYKDHSDVEFIILSNEDRATIQKFMDRKGYTFPVYSSREASPDVFSTRSIPTTYVISKEGDIRIKEVGAINWGGNKMIKIIEELVSGS